MTNKTTPLEEEQLRTKMTEFINTIDKMKILRTPWFNLWFYWKGLKQ